MSKQSKDMFTALKAEPNDKVAWLALADSLEEDGEDLRVRLIRDMFSDKDLCFGDEMREYQKNHIKKWFPGMTKLGPGQNYAMTLSRINQYTKGYIPHATGRRGNHLSVTCVIVDEPTPTIHVRRAMSFHPEVLFGGPFIVAIDVPADAWCNPPHGRSPVVLRTKSLLEENLIGFVSFCDRYPLEIPHANGETEYRWLGDKYVRSLGTIDEEVYKLLQKQSYKSYSEAVQDLSQAALKAAKTWG